MEKSSVTFERREEDIMEHKRNAGRFILMHPFGFVRQTGIG